MPNQKYHPEEKYIELTPVMPGERMPLISYFAGLFIRVRLGDKTPKLYVEYRDNAAVFGFGGNPLEGSLPEKQQKYIVVWTDLREVELTVLWELMRTQSAYIQIRGLD